MSDEKFEELIQLSTLYGLLEKAQEIIEIEGIMGGIDTWEHSHIQDIKNEVYREIESLKEEDL